MFAIIIVVVLGVGIPYGYVSPIHSPHNLWESAEHEKFPGLLCILVGLWPPDVPSMSNHTLIKTRETPLLCFLGFIFQFFIILSTFLLLEDVFSPIKPFCGCRTGMLMIVHNINIFITIFCPSTHLYLSIVF